MLSIFLKFANNISIEIEIEFASSTDFDNFFPKWALQRRDMSSNIEVQKLSNLRHKNQNFVIFFNILSCFFSGGYKKVLQNFS